MTEARIKLRLCRCRLQFASNGFGIPKCDECRERARESAKRFCQCGARLGKQLRLCARCRVAVARARRLFEALRIIEKRQRAEYLAAERQRNAARMRRVRAEARA